MSFHLFKLLSTVDMLVHAMVVTLVLPIDTSMSMASLMWPVNSTRQRIWSALTSTTAWIAITILLSDAVVCIYESKWRHQIYLWITYTSLYIICSHRPLPYHQGNWVWICQRWWEHHDGDLRQRSRICLPQCWMHRNIHWRCQHVRHLQYSHHQSRYPTERMGIRGTVIDTMQMHYYILYSCLAFSYILTTCCLFMSVSLRVYIRMELTTGLVVTLGVS